MLWKVGGVKKRGCVRVDTASLIGVKKKKVFFFVRSSRHFATWNVILFLN